MLSAKSRLRVLVWMAACHASGVIASPFHPFQAAVTCRQVANPYLSGEMWTAAATPSRLGVFTLGHVAACEQAKAASRQNRVCLPDGPDYVAEDVTTGRVQARFPRDFDACLRFTAGAEALRVRPGYVDFMPPNELRELRQRLPTVWDPTIDAALKDLDTIWYDEASMRYVYQDSFGSPKGLRVNRVGFDVGTNATDPDIMLLKTYFAGEHFKPPFGIFAGSAVPGVYSLSFWVPPRQPSGAVLPVRYWLNGSHWDWAFPVETLIGEVLFLQAPEGDWLPFEVRTRRRGMFGWHSEVFRPFPRAADLAEKVRELRPDAAGTDVDALLRHLEDASTLEPARLAVEPFAKIIAPIDGFIDVLPATTDSALIRRLLTWTPFRSVNGIAWKGVGRTVTHAASTRADFQIVPKGYTAGLLEVSDAACARCHDQTARPLGGLDERIVLYGELWGEDQVFTWHPFEIDATAYKASDDGRRANPRLVEAGLIEPGRPAVGSRDYAPLRKPYPAVY